MWFLTAFVFFFLMLRLYTRIFCLASFGIDDHIYAVAFVSYYPHVFAIPVIYLYGYTRLAMALRLLKR
ncbi:hypothetical protein IMZ48_09990 [Candidatus Bathyarchaeota archaeon]|nr:hypothetical protein [Candidatus Bathyarchaeota archaeon]